MREERGRVEREHEEEVERQRALERQRAEAAERLARQREEAERLREREIAERARAEREEQARLAAIRDAEIERVRLEAQARAEQELRTRQLAHQVELERQRAVTRANVRRLVLVTTAVLAAGTAIGAIALHFGYHEDAVKQSEAAHEHELRLERERLARVESNLANERRRVDDALRELRARPSVPGAPNTTSEGAGPQRVRPAPASRPPRTPPVGNKGPCRGDPNDPLNPCLNP